MSDRQGSMFPEPPPMPGTAAWPQPPAPEPAPTRYGDDLAWEPEGAGTTTVPDEAPTPLWGPSEFSDGPGPAGGGPAPGGFSFTPDDDEWVQRARDVRTARMSRPMQVPTAPAAAPQWSEPPGAVWAEPPGAPPPPYIPPPRPPSTAPVPPPPPGRPANRQLLLVVGSVVLALLVGAGALVAIQPWSTDTTLPRPPDTSSTVPVPPDQAGFGGTVDPGAQLVQQAQADSSQIPDGYWMPQVSSKKLGLLPDGVTYDNQMILDDHAAMRDRYGAKLLDSSEWSSFRDPDYWVSVVPSQATSSADSALAWCASQSLSRDECYAKLVSSTAGPQGATKLQR